MCHSNLECGEVSLYAKLSCQLPMTKDTVGCNYVCTSSSMKIDNTLLQGLTFVVNYFDIFHVIKSLVLIITSHFTFNCMLIMLAPPDPSMSVIE